MHVTFFVAGIPKPGGSKRAIPLMRHGRLMTRPNGSPIFNMVEDCKGTAGWRQSVAVFARQAHQGAPLAGPLAVDCEFVVTRPKGHFGTGKNAAVVKPSAPHWPTVKPDATKLFRSTEDALTGILWLDDAQIVRQAVSKSYGESPGAWITVTQLADGPENAVLSAGENLKNPIDLSVDKQ